MERSFYMVLTSSPSHLSQTLPFSIYNGELLLSSITLPRYQILAKKVKSIAERWVLQWRVNLAQKKHSVLLHQDFVLLLPLTIPTAFCNQNGGIACSIQTNHVKSGIMQLPLRLLFVVFGRRGSCDIDGSFAILELFVVFC